MRIRIGGQVAGKIDALIIHHARLVIVERGLVFKMLGKIFVIQPVKLGGRVFPAFERNDMLQLAWDHPFDIQAQARHVARGNADLLIAVDRQERPLRHELQGFRELRHFNHPVGLFRHFVTAVGDQLIVDLKQHEAMCRGIKFEAELRLVALFSFVERQIQRRGLRQHILGDAVGIPLIKIIRVFSGFSIAGIVLWQQPGLGRAHQLFILDGVAESDDQGPLPLGTLGVDHLGAGIAQRQAVQRRHRDPVAFHLVDGVGGHRRFDALADGQVHHTALIQRLQRL
ncbi:hypothetical protein D3C80_839210 [compost metagenome]